MNKYDANENQPELKNYLHKRILVKIQAKRTISGVLSGYDQYMNLVLDEAIDMNTQSSIGQILLRGNAILSIQPI